MHCAPVGLAGSAFQVVQGMTADLAQIARPLTAPPRQGEHTPAVLRALRDVGYSKLACVELSRDSHRAHSMVPQALTYLKNVERQL